MLQHIFHRLYIFLCLQVLFRLLYGLRQIRRLLHMSQVLNNHSYMLLHRHRECLPHPGMTCFHNSCICLLPCHSLLNMKHKLLLELLLLQLQECLQFFWLQVRHQQDKLKVHFHHLLLLQQVRHIPDIRNHHSYCPEVLLLLQLLFHPLLLKGISLLFQVQYL